MNVIHRTVVHYRRLPRASGSRITAHSERSLRQPWVGVEKQYGFSLTTQYAGDMGPSGQPARQREQMLLEAGYDPRSVLTVRQTHSRTVADLRGETDMTARLDDGRVPEADGILFDPVVQAAGVTVADCMPILLVPCMQGIEQGRTKPRWNGLESATPRVAALLHSGYKGTGIVTDALNHIEDACGVPASQMRAVLGPCIAGACYAVPAERAEAFRAAFGEGAAWHEEDASYIDLRAANLNLLEAAGVPEIMVIENCTHCDPRLGSYRRDGAGFTRMLAIAGPFGG